MASNSKAFLEFEDNEQTKMRENLLLKGSSISDEQQMPVKIVKPEPGFCVKTRDEKGQKVFINICKSKELPPPKDISENELINLLESEDPVYKIPMTLGDPHAVQDKGGNPSNAFDVVINTEFYDKIQSSLMFKTFMITVCMVGLENKHKTNLDRNDWTILQNKVYFGEITEITIKQKSKPLITELSSARPSDFHVKEIKQATKKKAQVPEFTLHTGLSETHQKSLFAQIHLPDVKNASDIVLDVGEDRIVLAALEKYKMDIFLPIDVDPNSAVAIYKKHDEVLSITISILENKGI